MDRYDAGDVWADYVTLPSGAQFVGSNCPEGAALAPGDALSWTSDGWDQGGEGGDCEGVDFSPSTPSLGRFHNGCAAKGTCGLPCSTDFLGGGWQLCFA